MKYKNKDGIELNYKGNDSHKVLVKEVITEAIKILTTYIDLMEGLQNMHYKEVLIF